MLRASAVLPFNSRDLAVTGLREELRRQLVAAGVRTFPRWDSVVITGPKEINDAKGRTWFEYQASVQVRDAGRLF
jgi:hypothetical protein